MNTDIIIKRQLKRKELNSYEIVNECSHGYPRVITFIPDDCNISKTIYWLTCPHLKRRISALESQGMVKEMTEYSRTHRDELKAYRESYDTDRKGLFDKKNMKIPESVKGCGIAGAEKGVKCLHAHYAYYLLRRDYPLGAKISEKIREEECNDIKCQRFDEGER